MNPEELEYLFPELFSRRRVVMPEPEVVEYEPTPAYVNRPLPGWNQINLAPLVKRYDGPAKTMARGVGGRLIIEFGK
jgi:hypothetical protein